MTALAPIDDGIMGDRRDIIRRDSGSCMSDSDCDFD